MCGIIGYTGHRPAAPLVMEGLRRLEYRGYDSSGICYAQNKELHIQRSEGKLDQLERKLEGMDVYLAVTAMAHTRWATHGAPTELNAHPHRSFRHGLCLIHNGIIENYQECKSELLQKGYEFRSETDTEVLVNCIDDACEPDRSLLESFAMALRKVKGAYAVCMMSPDEPDTLYAARHSAPLLLGIGSGEFFVASDIPAFLSYTKNVVFLEDGEIVRITPRSWEILSLDALQPVTKEIVPIAWDMQAAQKGGYKHFMLKEIFEQPQAISQSFAGRVDVSSTDVTFTELADFSVPARLRLVACGTSYHAGLWAMPLFEQWAQIPTTVEIASEFRYRKPLLDAGEVILVISQSGETADTLAALRIGKEKGAKVIGICNALGSSIARETDAVIYTQAGPEISVASTKALSTQMTVLLLLALYWGKHNGTLPQETLRQAVTGIISLPAQLESILPSLQSEAKNLALRFASVRGMFFLGRGQSYPLAMEGALKVKELAYIHAEGYASGEMKHGPIALIEPDFPTFALAPHDPLFHKTKSNLEEVLARSGPVVALTHSPKHEMELRGCDTWIMPEAWGPLSSLLMLPALQLFSYEAATYLGKDVDQPRNLAKSVTVE